MSNYNRYPTTGIPGLSSDGVKISVTLPIASNSSIVGIPYLNASNTPGIAADQGYGTAIGAPGGGLSGLWFQHGGSPWSSTNYAVGSFNDGTLHLQSAVNDGGGLSTIINNTATLSTAGDKLLSIQNNGTEKAYIDKDGLVFGKGFTMKSGGGGVLTFADGTTMSSAATGGGGGVTTVGTFSGSSQANGAGIASSVITFGPADTTNPGMITTGSQTIAGAKTFTGAISASNLSGTNTGDQTITLTSDVTGSGTGSFATTIAAGAVTLAKMANLAANSIIGNNTGSPATPIALTTAQTKTLLGYYTSSDSPTFNAITTTTINSGSLSGNNSGDLTLAAVGSSPSANGASLSGQTLTLQPADGTHPGLITTGAQTIAGAKTFSGTISASNLSGTNTGDQTITLTGDVTGSGTGSFAATIASAAVTLGKMANLAADSIIGNNTGSSATPIALTTSQVNTLLGTITALGAVGSSPNSNGASVSGSTLTLQPADGSNPGLITAGTQTIAGAKTWSGAGTFSSTTTFNGDMTCQSRVSNTGGVLYFGNTGTKYLYYDATNFNLTGGNLNCSADVVAYSSDARLKTNLVPIADAVAKVKMLTGYHFQWDGPACEKAGFVPGRVQDVGVIAQELQAVLPDLVVKAPFSNPSLNNTEDRDFLTVRYDKITALLIQAVKEQAATIDALTARLAALEAK